MGFHYSFFFWAFLPFGLLLFVYAWSRQLRRRHLVRLGDWALVRRYLSVDSLKRRQRKDILALIALVVLILTSTGPQFGARLKEVKQRGMDVFIAIDTSRSMLAEDVIPSRLDHAKRSLGLLVDKLAGNRVGIIAFAKYPVIQCPLTTDTEAAKLFLEIVDVNTVPKQGTAVGDAIKLALESFNWEDKTGKAIVLLTDGEDHESDPVEAAKMAKDKGVVLFTLGLGTSKGEVIKDRDEQGNVTAFHKFNGQMVLSRLDDALLTKIANMTGGKYYQASSSDREIDEIANQLNEFDKKEFASKSFERLQERYQVFGFFALLLLLFEFFFSENPGQWGRYRALVKMGLLLLILTPNAWADVKTHIQEGNRLAKRKDFSGARGEFESAQIDAPEMPYIPYNIALTYYAEGKFEEARRQFEKTLAMTEQKDLISKTLYNLGHVAYAEGKHSDAIEYFKKALRVDPTDQDAKYNIEYLKSGKAPQNPPQSQQQKSGNGQQQNNEKNEEKPAESGEHKEEKRPGEMSKEDAERILQMMSDKEKEDLKSLPMVRPGQQDDKKKDNPNAEDW